MSVNNKTQEAKKITEWASEPTWEELNENYIGAENAHNSFLEKLEDYRSTLRGGPAIKVRKGKSSVRPLLVRKNNEWKYSQLEEPFLSTPNLVKLKPKGPDDRDTYKQSQTLINYYWSVPINKIELVGDISRGLTDEGTIIVKNGWYTEKEKYTVTEKKPIYANAEESLMLMRSMVQDGSLSPEEAQARLQSGTQIMIGEEEVTVKKERMIKNHPVHDVCELEHVRIDPTCKGILRNAQFIIHEYDIDYSTLMKDKYNEETNTGYYKNLDSINFKDNLSDTHNYRYNSLPRTQFIFSDKARKKVRIKEYWGKWDINKDGKTESFVASWIGNVIVRMTKNPFPHKRLPFSYTTYMPIRGQIHGEPDSALLKENQESIGKMTRAYHDITKTNAIGQKLVMEDTFGSQAEWNAFETGNDARYRAGVNIDQSIKFNTVERIDSSIFQVIDLQQKDAELLTGNANYSRGTADVNQITGSSGNTSSERRELSILRRMSSQLFEDMIRQDIANMQAFASPEEVIRVTNEEYVTVRREDIQGEYDITIDVSTPAKDQETANTLAFILQSAGDSVDPQIKNMVLADMIRLKGRPDLANQIEEVKPQQNPEAEKMRTIQIENAELENKILKMRLATMNKDIEDVSSKILTRAAATEENKADVVLKIAKAKEHESRSDYYASQTDAADQRYLDNQNGTKRKQDVSDLVFRENSKRDIEEIKASARSGPAEINKIETQEKGL